MKFAAALLFGLAAADMSYKQVKRQDGGPIGAVFTTLGPMVQDLDQKITSYTGGSGDDIVAQSDKIVAAVQASVGTVSGVAPLDISAASNLVAPVQAFTATLQKTIDDLIAKKSVSVSNGLGGKVYANLMKQKAGATQLADAIKGKMPKSLKATADELSGDILTAINKGIAAFQDQAGAASGAGAGAGAGGAASSPSSGSSTSASGSAGGAGAGMSLSPAGSSTSLSGSGAGAGSSSSSTGASSGMSGMGAGSAAGASSPMTTSAPGSSPAVFTGAGASFKPASVFGLVAVAAAVFVF